MSDTTETPSTPAPATPAPDDRQVLIEELKAERQTLLGKIKDSEASMAAVLRERDAWKENASKLEPRAKEADALKLQVEGFVNQGRETALVEKLRASLPGADPLALRGALIALAESGRAQRYPEQTEVEAAKVLDLIRTEAPGLTRPPTSAGGSSVVRSQPTRTGYRGPFDR